MTAFPAQGREPWQLAMFRRSLKKQRKLAALLALLGDVQGQECLLVTCGDNNGALNWHFREHGGRWAWGDVIDENLAPMRELLGEPVYQVPEDRLPFADNHFDWAISIDVLEHLEDDLPFLCELHRVLRPGGRALVTVPNGDPRLLANRVKWRVGMTPSVYGHTRAGYTVAELQDRVIRAGFTSVVHDGYSRFFTEMVELFVNFGYVRLLSRKQSGGSGGHIAPTTAKELNAHGAAYRLYALAFPIMRLVSGLDALLPASTNNAIIVRATKPGAEV